MGLTFLCAVSLPNANNNPPIPPGLRWRQACQKASLLNRAVSAPRFGLHLASPCCPPSRGVWTHSFQGHPPTTAVREHRARHPVSKSAQAVGLER